METSDSLKNKPWREGEGTMPCVLPAGLLPYQTQVNPKITGKLSAKAIEKRILRDLNLLREALGYDKTIPPENVILTLQLNWQSKSGEFSADLRQQLAARLREAAPLQEALRVGYIFCHFCRSYTCNHSAPVLPEEVFLSYNERGVPRYGAFHQVLLDLRDERSELLFQNDAPLLAIFQYGRDLKREQLKLFGRQSAEYSLLGQVVVGYMRLGDYKFALTLQVIQNGKMVLLNTIMAPAAWDWWQKYRLSFEGRQVDAAIESLRRELQGADKMSFEKRSEFLRKVPNLLRRLAGDLEAVQRRRERRTWHAALRHKQKRPVAQALADLRIAAAINLFYDESKDTLVLRAEKNRIHIFSPHGKLVTSLHLEKKAIEKRLSSGRWQLASPEQLQKLKLKALSP